MRFLDLKLEFYQKSRISMSKEIPIYRYIVYEDT